MDLKQFFKEHKKVAIAFSGGVDSAYLLYAAVQSGAAVKAYYVKTVFQPQHELEDALRLARELNAPMQVLSLNILCGSIPYNPPDRCYHCKKMMFSAIMAAAADDGFDLLLDGTNASDDTADRPGMRALRELSVRSPLRECGLTKETIRKLSKEAGLFTHSKPAYACLATRIPIGAPISLEKLQRTEAAEAYLYSLGFRDFRVRSLGNIARLQFNAQDWPAAAAQRETITQALKKYYSDVLLDMEVRK